MPKEIDRLIGQIKNFEAELPAKIELFIERLADIGLTTATSEFSKADYNAGTNDVVVSVARTPTGFVLNADGKSVIFVEFGAGDAAVVPADVESSDITLGIGTYSTSHAKQYSTYGYWYYQNVRLTEIPPAGAMSAARRAMIEAIPQIAKEVFG